MLLIHLKKFVISVRVGVVYIIRLGGNDVSEIKTDRKVFVLGLEQYQIQCCYLCSWFLWWKMLGSRGQ